MQIQRVNTNNNPDFGINIRLGTSFSEEVIKKNLKKPITDVLTRLTREFAYSDTNVDIGYICYNRTKPKDLYGDHGKPVCKDLAVYNWFTTMIIERLIPENIYKAVSSLVKMTEDSKSLGEFVGDLKRKQGLDVGFRYDNECALKYPPARIKEIILTVNQTLSKLNAKDKFIFEIDYTNEHNLIGKLTDRKLFDKYNKQKTEITNAEDLFWHCIAIPVDTVRNLAKEHKISVAPQIFSLDISNEALKKQITKSVRYLSGKRSNLEKIESETNIKIVQEELLEKESQEFSSELQNSLLKEGEKSRTTIEEFEQAQIPSQEAGQIVAEGREKKLSHNDLREVARESYVPTLEEEFDKLENR